MRFKIGTLRVSFLRVCIALFVFISANHCFLEEGVSRGSVSLTTSDAFSGLDYHFGAAFGHRHSPAHGDEDSEPHPHGDAMSLQSELVGIKVKRVDHRLLSPLLLSLDSLLIPQSEANFFRPSARRAPPTSLCDTVLSLVSLSIASQAPPRVVSISVCASAS